MRGHYRSFHRLGNLPPKFLPFYHTFKYQMPDEGADLAGHTILLVHALSFLSEENTTLRP